MRRLRLVYSRPHLVAGAALCAMMSANAGDEGNAAAMSPVGHERSVTVRDPGALQLAQGRSVEMYVDREGREIYVDPRTGEVIAVRRPSPLTRRTLPDLEIHGRVRRAPDPYEPYDLDRRRIEREIELGRREPPADERYYDPEPYDPGYDDDYRDQPAERHLRRVPRRDTFPERPAAPQEEPRYVERERVERAPLVEPGRREERSAPHVEEEPRTRVPSEEPPPAVVWDKASEDVAKIQVLLDRGGISPGVVDGRMGDNVNKALEAYRAKFGRALRTYDKESIDLALAESGGDAFTRYEISPADVAGQFVASIPDDYGEKAKLERLGFTSVAEMLAERFHMDEKYLRALNPGIDFGRAGSIIRVVNPGQPTTGEVKRIVADKNRKQVRAFDAAGRLVAAYPATIGSDATPSPTGVHAVSRIAFDPNYTYNPKINFKQGDNDRVLTLPPGPNGPVGTIWIALDKPTYGIHGTPEPSKIGKTSSHGCVRLTNWDAHELAKMVKPGVEVEFVE